MKPSLRAFGITLLLAAAVSWAEKPEPAPPLRLFTLGGTSFSLNLDPDWKVTDPAPDSPDSVLFNTSDPLRMSTRVSLGRVPANADTDEFRAWVLDQSTRDFLRQSVEKELVVEPMGKGDVRGARVCATDRAPKPDEYKYICQGIFTHEGAALIFTLLYNESGMEDAKQALAALDALHFTQRT